MDLTAETHSSTPLWIRRLAHGGVNLFNTCVQALRSRPVHTASLPELSEVMERSRSLSDISDHLVPLFCESIEARPRLIVELGVRGGESTFVFERVAARTGATLISVDLEDCSRVSNYKNWHFVRSDDIAFAREFPAWCNARKISGPIDLLFIDTSHVFEHTLQEMQCWLPLVAPGGKVFFHDSNQRRVYWRKDGTVGLGWWNERGVIRAIETYFRKSYNERIDFVDSTDGWIIRHTAACSGFTILSRIDSLS